MLQKNIECNRIEYNRIEVLSDIAQLISSQLTNPSVGYMTWHNSFITRGREPWTLTNRTPDSEKTKPAALYSEIVYPKPDGVLSFDLLTSLSRSGG